MEPPFAALGVISGSSASAEVHQRYVGRRAVIRDSWLKARANFAVRFVLRCGELPSSHPVHTEADALCTGVSVRETRHRGPILALVAWLREAPRLYPSARFIAKADDDVYLHLGDLEHHLRAIPAAAAATAYYGYTGFFTLVQHGDDFFNFVGWSPQEGYAASAARRGVASRCASNASWSCAGPFPMVCGPFIALGRDAAAALVREPRLDGELDALSRLPRKHPFVVEDAWLGAALWRFVGRSLPINVFTLNTRWGHLYVDGDGFRVSPSTVIWHNRRKFAARVVLLHLYAQRDHLRCDVSWRQTRRPCCRSDRGMRPGDAAGWPWWTTDISGGCVDAAGAPVRRTDLRNVSNLRRLGIVDALPGGLAGASDDEIGRWMRTKA